LLHTIPYRRLGPTVTQSESPGMPPSRSRPPALVSTGPAPLGPVRPVLGHRPAQRGRRANPPDRLPVSPPQTRPESAPVCPDPAHDHRPALLAGDLPDGEPDQGARHRAKDGAHVNAKQVSHRPSPHSTLAGSR